MRWTTKQFLLVLGFLCLVPGLATRAADVTIKADKEGGTVKTSSYEAVIESDGCLTSLRVGGVEFLKSATKVPRGAYLFQGSPVKLPTIEKSAEDVITARGDKASIRYAFGADSLTCTATNATPTE